MKADLGAVTVPLHLPLLRGERRLRIALVGLPGSGAGTIFQAMESSEARAGQGPGTQPGGDEYDIDIGLDQARIRKVPGALLPGLLQGTASLPPDVIVQVLDATSLEPHLKLTLELLKLGRPLVLAMNKMDAARAKGVHIGTKVLGRRLGVTVVPTIGEMGYGLRELFVAAVQAAREARNPALAAPLASASSLNPALLAEVARRPGGVREREDWRYWLDELFLSPRWGLVGSAVVFALALFVVFDLSARIDALTSARLAEWASAWQPQTLWGVVLRAVADGLIGLVAIVVPYMIPLVVLLIALEQAGIMARIAFAVDRVFHRIGVHGDVAFSLLLGLGCNVPALSAIAAGHRGRERTIASILVTFVPCSARSAIILAMAGKYLGAWGVLAVFAVAGLVIAALGIFLRRRLAGGTPGHVHEIPPYAAPQWLPILRETWLRTREILTIVTPLLIGGSVVLALLSHVGGDDLVNAALAPITHAWLGLPVALGVPLLFGVLRKELSLAMIYTALGGLDVGAHLDAIQIFTFLVFLTLYVPCISTFAVLVKTLGRRTALHSVSLSVGVALVAGGAARFGLQALRLLTG